MRERQKERERGQRKRGGMNEGHGEGTNDFAQRT